MTDRLPELIVFPTELALRRFQQEQALARGIVDASNHLTFVRLRKLCLPYARVKGTRMDSAQQLMMRNQVVEVARGHFSGQGTLGDLSFSALSEVLDRLITELAACPAESAVIIDCLLGAGSEKLRQLGTLFSVWRAIIKQEGFVDALDLNLAILRLLKGDREKWPPKLRNAHKITFRSVRWLNPFEESCVAALNHRLKLEVESALPAAHAEGVADRLGLRIWSGTMTMPWASWAEDLGDALTMGDTEIFQSEGEAHISFSRSASTYGEIEDLARRIGWYLQDGEIAPNRVALVVPNIGPVQDIIPNVFGRFKIPYYFRRGRPVLSSPVVKAFLSWLSFPLRAERDALIDLVRNPAIQFDAREETVDRLQNQPPRLDGEPAGKSARSAADALEILKARIVIPEDHFNAAALNAVETALESFGAHPMPLRELVDLLEELLENATVKPRDSHEQGVWVLNPHDAVGLEFDVVLFAGLNEGEFPSIPQQDALLDDREREWIRHELEERGRRLPVLALPMADRLYEQQYVLFLCVIGMARRHLVLSYQSADQNGDERSASEYFRKLWMLAGWPTQETVEPGAYDQWRIGRLGGIFAEHLLREQTALPEDREPMPGESFMTVVPLPLCRAEDEALQAAVSSPVEISDGNHAVSSTVEHLVEMLRIEAERDAFVETPVEERFPSSYCGHMASMKERVAAWLESRREISPTALEKLAQCRYVFFVEQVLGVRDQRVADDTPDPLDRGTLIHSILKEIYEGIAAGKSGVEASPLWAVETATGWMLRGEGGVDAIALAVFSDGCEAEYVAYAHRIAEARMAVAKLGHPGVWAAEREKILEQILNFVRHDASTCPQERRFPALFEFRFGGDSAVELGGLRIKGVIDRIDLRFAASGELSAVRVLDYKGASRALGSHNEYLEEIRRNLDCQLPIYALAAQQHFFGECNTPAANEKSEAGYLIYERDRSKISGALKKSLVSMAEPELLEAFLNILMKNLRLLKTCDFSVDPLIASYGDYESICRVALTERDE